MNREKEFFDENCVLTETGFDVMTEGKDAILFSTGSILEEVMSACEDLSNEGISVKVISVSKLKPFGYDEAAELISGYDKVFTVEEHSVIGGLGDAVASAIIGHGVERFRKIGINDVFGQSGKPVDLLREYELTGPQIAEKILRDRLAPEQKQSEYLDKLIDEIKEETK